MSGIYTNLAKKRAEQSKEQGTFTSPPQPPEKPIAKQAQETPTPTETRKLGNQETRKQGLAGNTATEAEGFDLNIEPYKKGTFIFTYAELDAIDDLKKQLKRRMDLPATQYDIVRAAIHIITENYRQHGSDSLIVQRIKTKKAR
jgi:hypothetical protein